MTIISGCLTSSRRSSTTPRLRTPTILRRPNARELRRCSPALTPWTRARQTPPAVPPTPAAALKPRSSDIAPVVERSLTGPEHDLADAIARLSETRRDGFAPRLERVEAAVLALLDGTLGESLRAEAEREAHKLAGALGTFGVPGGSELAREPRRRSNRHGIGHAPRRTCGGPRARGRARADDDDTCSADSCRTAAAAAHEPAAPRVPLTPAVLTSLAVTHGEHGSCADAADSGDRAGRRDLRSRRTNS